MRSYESTFTSMKVFYCFRLVFSIMFMPIQFFLRANNISSGHYLVIMFSKSSWDAEDIYLRRQPLRTWHCGNAGCKQPERSPSCLVES